MDYSEQISQAVELYRQGDADAALDILRTVVQQEPSQTEAWWGIAVVSSSLVERRQAIRRVLELDPDHEGAKKMQRKIDPAAAAPDSGSKPQSTKPKKAPPSPQKQKGSAPAKSRLNSILIFLAGVLITLLVLMAGVGGFYLFFLPQPTPTPIVVAAATDQPPPATATLTPDPTIMPTVPAETSQVAPPSTATPTNIPLPTATDTPTSISRNRPTPTFTHTPIHTVTPTNTPSATPNPLSNLKSELFFSYGWSKNSSPPDCLESPPTESALPLIEIDDSSAVCIWGFPDEEVTLVLYQPDGSYAGSETAYYYWDNDTKSTGMIALMYFPPILPAGEWRIVAKSDSAFTETTFDVTLSNDPDLFVVGEFNPLSNFGCETISPGKQVELIGVNLPPHQTIPLGIYKSLPGEEPDELIIKEVITPDSLGQFTISIPTEGLDESTYYAVAVIQPNIEGSSIGSYDDLGPNTCFQVGLPTPTATSTATPTYTPTPTDTPTATPELVSNVKKELNFLGVGGRGPGCAAYSAPLDLSEPVIDIQVLAHIPSSGCLWGFPDDEEVSLDLYQPNGEYIGSGTASEGEFDMLFPAALPAGEWQLVAYSDSTFTETTFNFTPHNNPELVLMTEEGLNPLFNPIDRAFCNNPYWLGEQVEIIGVNLPPNQAIPLGIYNNSGELIFESLSEINTDSLGGFNTSIPTEGLDFGGYYVVAVINPEADTASFPGYSSGDAGPATCFQLE